MAHLRERTDVQNIDLMNLAGFCRNCLSRWYREAAAEKGIAIADPEAREIVYGMPYKEWQAKHQTRGDGRAEGGVREGESGPLNAVRPRWRRIAPERRLGRPADPARFRLTGRAEAIPARPDRGTAERMAEAAMA